MLTTSNSYDDPLDFEVVVRDGGGETRHHATMSRETCSKIRSGIPRQSLGDGRYLTLRTDPPERWAYAAEVVSRAPDVIMANTGASVSRADASQAQTFQFKPSNHSSGMAAFNCSTTSGSKTVRHSSTSPFLK